MSATLVDTEHRAQQAHRPDGGRVVPSKNTSPPQHPCLLPPPLPPPRPPPLSCWAEAVRSRAFLDTARRTCAIHTEPENHPERSIITTIIIDDDDDRCLLRSDTEPVGFFAAVVLLETPPTRPSEEPRNFRPRFVTAEKGIIPWLPQVTTRRAEGNGWPQPQGGRAERTIGRRWGLVGWSVVALDGTAWLDSATGDRRVG
jgi:hypothetical protein